MFWKSHAGKNRLCTADRVVEYGHMTYPESPRAITRRGTLGGLGALLAMGAWPGARAAETAIRPASQPKPIRFVAVNDFHHENKDCDPWMEKLFRHIAATEGAALCLGLGDLANTGKRESMQAILRLSALAGIPFHPTPGNHDLDLSPVDGFYEEVFPNQRNYLIRHSGWQFILIDSTEGTKWQDVTISKSTFDWLDKTLPSLDPLAPTVLATHFPLASGVRMCPLNADAVLARFIGHNLRGVFGGHYHARTSSPRGDIRLVTNACASRVRGNHDGSPEKGYLIVDGDAMGQLKASFVLFTGE
jgi:Calcineurin-like phosphoesterase